MKTKYLAIVMLFAAKSSFGQLELGPKAGYNHVFTSYAPSNSTVTLPDASGAGFHLGAFAQMEAGDAVYLGGEVLLSQRATNEILIDDNTLDGIRVKSDSYTYRSAMYLDIPIFVKYALNMTKSRYGASKKLCFYGGPMASLYMFGSGGTQETITTELHDQVTVVRSEHDYTKPELKEHFNSFHLGVMAGAQFSFSFGLNIDLRITRSLTPINKDLLGDYGKIGHTVLQFGIGYNVFGSQY